MSWRSLRRIAGAWVFLSCLAGGDAATGQTAAQPTPAAGAPQTATPAPVEETVVVSATKIAEDPIDIPAAVTVVKGEELRRRGTRTLADAIQDVVGLDTGNGSDNGARFPNIGLYGIKEFDALLITLDGVPVGGPFNPNLAQIPVDEIDRIEIVRGPQGTLYGVSAFAGMIQVFTRHDTGGTWGSARVGGFGAFEQGYGDLNIGTRVSPDFSLKLSGSIARGNGWQDRTDLKRDQLLVSAEKSWGETKLGTSILWLRDTNFWGSPLPVDAGEPLPGFRIDRNYGVGGARVDHHVIGLFTNVSTPLSQNLRFENVLGVTEDDSDSIRSFINGTFDGSATAEGIALRPKETVVYDDAHIVASFMGAGQHRLVGGAALTWGTTKAAGHGFDIELQVDPVVVPDYRDTPFGDNRNFRDRRTFVGFYLNDEWAPVRWFTLTAGARYDLTSERLHVFQQEIGDPNFDTVDDHRSDNAFSGGIAGMFHLLDRPTGPLSAVNVYGAWRNNFKPAAPNLSEAESARILEPERTNTEEAGIKTLWFDRLFSFNVTWFHMIFRNLVVSVPGPGGAPALTNAGAERFQGWEFELGYALPFLEGLSFSGGYAHHDARFIRFSFFTPEGDLRVVDGKRLELAPRDLWNAKLVLAPKAGFGGFVAARHQNHRPLNRRNTFYTPSYFETDAGLSYDFERFRLAVIGRNLGDSRHYVTESEIGDSQFYMAPPRGVTAELTVRF